MCVCVDLLLFLLLLGFKYLNGDLKLIFYLFKQKKKALLQSSLAIYSTLIYL